MNPGQIIGLGAASVAFLCFVGLLVAHIVAPPPDGQHARRPGRHRDHGETHEGAGSAGHDEELAGMRAVMARARRRRNEGGAA